MQTHAKTFIVAVQARGDVSMSVCGYRGKKIFLPFFFIHALFRAIFSRADVVLLGDALLSPIFLILRRTRRAVIVHGLDLTWNVPGYRSLIRTSLKRAHRVIAVSQATANVVESLGIPSDRIAVIPCGIDIPAPPTPSERQRTLLSVGRLVPRKGHAWFIEYVFAPLAKSDPTLHYVIAGDGGERRHIERLIESLGLKERVALLGEVVEKQKEQLMQECALLVMPNVPVAGTMEGFGIVCIEAAGRGLPVVASRLEGLTDAVLEGVTGQMFTPLDAASAQSALLSALQKHWDPVAMHTACKRQFDSHVTTHSLLNALP